MKKKLFFIALVVVSVCSAVYVTGSQESDIPSYFTNIDALASGESESQRRLFGAALAYKRGNKKGATKTVKNIARNLTTKQIRDYAKK